MKFPTSSLASLSSVITKGTTPTTLGYAHTDSGIPFLRVQNIFGGSVNFDEDTLFIDSATHNALKRSQIQGGDVLVTIAGTIGRTGVVPIGAPEMNCNQAVAIVRTTGQIETIYLRYWLESQDARSQMLGSTVTGTISNLSLSQLGELRVPLPSLEDQRRIAAILHKADALRTKRREALAQLDRLAQSIFVEMFGDPVANPRGWPQVTFEKFFLDKTSSCQKIPSSEYQKFGKIPVIDQGQTAIAGYCDDTSLVSEISLPVIVFGDHTRVVKYVDFPFVAGADGVKVLQSVQGVNPRFAAFLLAKLPIPNLGYSRHMKEVKRQSFICPSRQLQDGFEMRLLAIDRIKDQALKAADDGDSLFASLQHRAFQGEL